MGLGETGGTAGDSTERIGDEGEGAVSGPVVHGGEGDPLGGAVAELEEDEGVSQGVPEQESSGGASDA